MILRDDRGTRLELPRLDPAPSPVMRTLSAAQRQSRPLRSRGEATDADGRTLEGAESSAISAASRSNRRPRQFPICDVSSFARPPLPVAIRRG